MSSEIKKTENLDLSPIESYLTESSVNEHLLKKLGENSNAFITSLVQIATSNDMLKNAEPRSLMNAALMATSLNLPLNNTMGLAYIVPFNSRQKDGSYKVEGQFQLGYKGFVQLAVRSGQFSEIIAKEVYDGQIVKDNSFLGYHFNWSEKKSDKIVAYASYFKLLNGFESTYIMSIEDIEAHAKKYSQTYKKNFGLWKDDFHKMALKTVSKLHLNSGKAPLSAEMKSAVLSDQSVIKNDNFDPSTDIIDVDYIDNEDEKKPTEEEVQLAQFKESLAGATTRADLQLLLDSAPPDSFSEIERKLINEKWKKLKP